MTFPTPAEVFTPGTFPAYSYIDRKRATARPHEPKDRSTISLELLLSDGIGTPGMFVSIAGPSKSGKTVLVERVVGPQRVVSVSGATFASPSDLWEAILDQLQEPETEEDSAEREKSAGATAGSEGGINFFGFKALGKGEVRGDVKSTSHAGRVKGRRGFAQVVERLIERNLVLFLDDFHYAAPSLRASVVKSLKEAVRRGAHVVTASVPHHGDDVVRANPELRGRVVVIDVPYWSESELVEIAAKGFATLGVTVPASTIRVLANESVGSPQIMQALCLNLCRECGVGDPTQSSTLSPSKKQEASILQRTALLADYRSFLTVLNDGPGRRGMPRRIFQYQSHLEGDIYNCVLQALGQRPAALTFPLPEIVDRAKRVCDGDAPTRSDLQAACKRVVALVHKRFPGEHILEWDEQKQTLEVLDPYWMFYLRWSGKLEELTADLT